MKMISETGMKGFRNGDKKGIGNGDKKKIGN